MVFGGLIKTTLVDYPGKVAATVFTLGCNFRCPYCHNPELVLPDLIEKQPIFTEEEILSFLKERRGLLEGVCITGGEPLIYPELEGFIKKVKKLGYPIKLDTNGSFPDYLKDLIRKKFIDYVAMDIKAPKEKYKIFTLGEISPETVEKSIYLIKKEKIEYEFRTTLAPGILEKDDILKIVAWIKPAKRFFLQEFKAIKVLDENFKNQAIAKKYFSKEKIKDIMKKIKPFFIESGIR